MNNTLKPCHSLLANLSDAQTVEGAYRLVPHRRATSSDGVPIGRARLADRSGTIEAWRPGLDDHVNTVIPQYTLVFAAFRTVLKDGQLIAILHELDLLGGTPDPALALDRLPRPAANSPDALDRLADLMKTFQSAALHGAVERVLLQDALMLDLLARPDDLFARSVAAAVATQDFIFPMFNDNSLCETAIAACLMRLMGRLEEPNRTRTGFPTDVRPWSARLALKRCEPALTWLSTRDPNAARRMRCLLGEPSLRRPEPEMRLLVESVIKAERRFGFPKR